MTVFFVYKLFLLFFFRNFASHVCAAVRANNVSRNSLTAFRANGKLNRGFAIVRTTDTGAMIGMFSLGDSHFLLLWVLVCWIDFPGTEKNYFTNICTETYTVFPTEKTWINIILFFDVLSRGCTGNFFLIETKIWNR